MKYFVFDVESIGLHGEGYAVGFVVMDGLKELESGTFACDPDLAYGDTDDRKWVFDNIPKLVSTCTGPREVRERFWREWVRWKEEGAIMVSDCGWPVEARFLNACVDDDKYGRKWEGPYPLHDLCSMLLSHGEKPTGEFPRLENELPKHDPLCDARQTARLFASFIDVYK